MKRVDASVIVVTRNRPDMVERCLGALQIHDPQPMQIILVDASDGSATRELTAKFAGVQYIHFPNGENQRPESKNIGMRGAQAPILAFLDDDSVVSDNWLSELIEPFSDPEVGCVGGGIIEPGTRWQADEPVGRVLANGDLSQNFSPEHDANQEVDHVKGCNMSFRRELLMSVGGFDPGYTGDNLREETDACLAIKSLGKKVLFCPSAVVTHLRAPRETVTRSMDDPSKVYYYSRNQTYFIVKHYPHDLQKLWVNYVVECWRPIKWLRPNRELAGRAWRIALTAVGKLTGTAAALTSGRVWATWRGLAK